MQHEDTLQRQPQPVHNISQLRGLAYYAKLGEKLVILASSTVQVEGDKFLNQLMVGVSLSNNQ
jgi:hypothetical protein